MTCARNIYARKLAFAWRQPDTLVLPLTGRWDCEETAQIWSSCADVRISAAA